MLAQSPEPEAHDKVLDNSRSNWNLEMLVFEERGKPEDPEKNLSVKQCSKILSVSHFILSRCFEVEQIINYTVSCMLCISCYRRQGYRSNCVIGSEA